MEFNFKKRKTFFPCKKDKKCPPPCNDDKDCPKDQECINGECKCEEGKVCPPTPNPPGCDKCPPKQKCVDETCVCQNGGDGPDCTCPGKDLSDKSEKIMHLFQVKNTSIYLVAVVRFFSLDNCTLFYCMNAQCTCYLVII